MPQRVEASSEKGPLSLVDKRQTLSYNEDMDSDIPVFTYSPDKSEGKIKMKTKAKNKPKLDREERELLASFEKDEWKPVKNVRKEVESAGKSAHKTLSKDVRINIRLSSTDVSNIKQIAAFEGLPYQTLISSVLHKFAAGHLRTA